MAAPVQTQKKEVPISPVRSRLSAFASKFFESKADAKRMAIQAESRVTRRGALKSMAALLGLSVVTACAPPLVHAEPKDPTSKPKEIAKKESKGVTYETFSDPAELEPYFKNAEGKMIKLKPNKWVNAGDYDLRVADHHVGVEFSIKSVDGTYEKWSFGFNAPMKEVNVLVIDVEENNPLVKGKMLVFADSANVYFQFFDKMQNAHSLAGVPLGIGGMRRGPIKTGFEITEDSIAIINAPSNLKEGDVVAQAELGLRNNPQTDYEMGSSYSSYFVLAPNKPVGTLVASL